MLFIIDPDSGVCDLDLAGAHGLKGGLMLGGRYAGAAGSVAGDGRLGKGGLDQQGVGYDADIGAQTDQFDLNAFLFALLEDLHEFGELRAAESGLVDDVVRVDQFRDVGTDLPAIGSADAVGDRSGCSGGPEDFCPPGWPGRNRCECHAWQRRLPWGKSLFWP